MTKKIENDLIEMDTDLEKKIEEHNAGLTKAEASLVWSENMYRKIVEEAGDCVYSSDHNGNFSYINPTCIKATGYSEKELTGKNFRELIPPDWKDKVAKFYKEQFDKKIQESTFSFPIISKSGEKKWVEQIVTQQKDGGRITGHFAIVRDITQRKKEEEKLKEYQYFFNNSHDLICIANMQNYFEIINPNFPKVLGYSEKELLEYKLLDFIHPDDVNATLKEIEKIKTSVVSTDFINRFRKKDDSYLWLEWNLTYDPVMEKFYGAGRNITERKKSEEKFRGFMESAPDAIVIINKEGKMQLVNAQTEKMFGYMKAELIGKEVELLMPPRFRHAHYGQREGFFDNPKYRHMGTGLSLFGQHKDGKEFPVDISLGSFETEEGMLVSAAIRDITEQKHAENTLKQKSEELLRSNKDLEQFAFVTSHDLQEPLRTISNYVELLDETYPEAKEQDIKQYLSFITSASSRMQNLIKDLMEFSRVDKDILFEDVDCNIVLKEVLEDLDSKIKESNAKIIIGTLPVLKGNYTRMKQLFQNLIDNAIKFRRKNVAPVIEVSAVDKVAEYLFSIKDNGIGIEEPNINKLFNIFQRLNPKEEYPGTGIGLSTVKKIVNLHKGQICVESRFNEGSIFYFTIPKDI